MCTSTSPYRTHPEPAAKNDRETGAPNSDLLGVFGVLWVVCSLTVAAAVVQYQTFDAELTVALLIAVLVPFLTKDALCDLIKRLPRGIWHRK